MMHIARAEPTAKNLKAILGLIEETKGWLALKDTDQWANPWPDEQARDDRVLRGLKGRKTWIVWDGDIPAATVTTHATEERRRLVETGVHMRPG